MYPFDVAFILRPVVQLRFLEKGFEYARRPKGNAKSEALALRV
jgi:hypothetical protein